MSEPTPSDMTPWFPPRIKPVREGWYVTDMYLRHFRSGDYRAYCLYRWWDGSHWSDCTARIEWAEEDYAAGNSSAKRRRAVGWAQSRIRWRGLRSHPSTGGK